MPHPHYQQKLYLPEVDTDDVILGKIERWEAHKKGILHRGFTAILTYRGQLLLQHRKHPAFDKYWDLTFSSHAVYKDNKLQSDIGAIYEALTREWQLGKNDLMDPPVFKGKFYYQSKDPASIYTEHEFDYIYLAELRKLPHPTPEFAYGFEVVPNSASVNKFARSHRLAPWIDLINFARLLEKSV